MSALVPPLTTPLTLAEARARDHIAKTCELMYWHEISEATGMSLLWEPLNVFRPRCPVCRNVVAFGPWREGSRLVACRCGHGWAEARIWHGVEKP